MTRSILITLFLYISTTSGQSPRDLLVSRCPCMNRQQCIIRLGDDDFDDDEIFRSVPVCPLGTVPCCSRFQMRAIVREAFSGAPPPLIQTGRDLIPGPAVGPTSGELDELARLLETQAPAGLQQVPAGQGRQQPDFAALLAGLDVPGAGAPGDLVVGDISEADALAGLDSLAAGLTGGVAGQGVLPPVLPGISDVDALAGLDSLATSLPDPGVGGVSDADALAGLDSLAAGLGAGLPTPSADLLAAVPAPVQAPVPVAPVHVPGPLPQQAPGPQAPSVQIIGPQPVYISSDRVVGPSVNGAGRALHSGTVEQGRQADQLSGDQLAFLRALRALFR